MKDKIENKIVIDASTINKITKILTDYWDSLCKKYNVSVSFNIIKTSTYINEVLDNVKSDVRPEEGIDNMLSTLRDGESLMHNDAIVYKDENTGSSVVDNTGVYMLLERYMCIISEAGDDVDGLINYLKKAMLHEMGHILVNYDLYNVDDWDKIRELLDTLAKNKEECKERLKNPNLSQEEKMKIYYNDIISERMANERVGLNYNDLIFVISSTVEDNDENELSIDQ